MEAFKEDKKPKERYHLNPTAGLIRWLAKRIVIRVREARQRQTSPLNLESEVNSRLRQYESDSERLM